MTCRTKDLDRPRIRTFVFKSNIDTIFRCRIRISG